MYTVLSVLGRLSLMVADLGTANTTANERCPKNNKWKICLDRFVEPSFPFLQLVPGLPHAFCIFLHWVRGICRIQKGSICSTSSHWRLKMIYRCESTVPVFAPICSHIICFGCVGCNGTSLWSSCAAVAAGPACAGHCVGGISPPTWQHSPEEPLRWVNHRFLNDR